MGRHLMLWPVVLAVLVGVVSVDPAQAQDYCCVCAGLCQTGTCNSACAIVADSTACATFC